MQSNGEQFLEAIDKIKNSKGYYLNSKAYELENSFIIAVVSFGELQQLLEKVPVFSQGQRYNDEERKFHLNAARLFANYLSNTMAFRDHMRIYMRKIYKDEKLAFNGSYKNKIKSNFANDRVSQFLEDLRIFSQHIGILPTTILTKVKNGSFHSTIVIRKSDLLKTGYKWGKGKEFIDTMREEENILDLANDYIHKTIFPWLMNQQAKEHNKEFEELKQLRKMAKDLLETKEPQNS